MYDKNSQTGRMRRREREGLHDNGNSDGLHHHDAANVTCRKNVKCDINTMYDKNSRTGRMRRCEREGIHGNSNGLDHHDTANVTGRKNVKCDINSMYDKIP